MTIRDYLFLAGAALGGALAYAAAFGLVLLAGSLL